MASGMRSEEEGGSAPTLAAWPPLLSRPAPRPPHTGALPLNPSPWICEPQERPWHIKIMKLKVTFLFMF